MLVCQPTNPKLFGKPGKRIVLKQASPYTGEDQTDWEWELSIGTVTVLELDCLPSEPLVYEYRRGLKDKRTFLLKLAGWHGRWLSTGRGEFSGLVYWRWWVAVHSTIHVPRSLRHYLTEHYTPEEMIRDLDHAP